MSVEKQRHEGDPNGRGWQEVGSKGKFSQSFQPRKGKRSGEKLRSLGTCPVRARPTVEWWEYEVLVAEDSLKTEIYLVYCDCTYHLLTHLCRFPRNGAIFSISGQ